MNTNSVYQEWLDHMSAPHSDVDALSDYYIDRHITNRVLAKNHELYARMASHVPLNEFDECVIAVDGDKARSAIYPPIRSKK